MRFARIGAIGHEVPVVLVDDTAYDISSLTSDIDGAFLRGGFAGVAEALAQGTLPVVTTDGARFGAPIKRPGAVVCIGMNYAAHAAESGSAPPERIVVFFKHPNTVVGPNDAVAIPARSTKTDWEVELGVVIGKPMYELTGHEEALDAIAGFAVVDDISERTWQIEESGGQWSKGKNGPGFSPTGPWLVTAEELDATNLRLRSTVNGEPRQDSSTADLVFSVAEILVQLSNYMRLDPGDLVLTGTPEGVALSGRFPYLRPGDVVECSIDGLGTQRHEFVAGSEHPHV